MNAWTSGESAGKDPTVSFQERFRVESMFRGLLEGWHPDQGVEAFRA